MPTVFNEGCTSINSMSRGVVPEAVGAGYKPVPILFISSVPEDQFALRRILRPACQVMPARTCRQALDRLSRGDIPVVFCDRVLADGTWSDLLNHLSSSSAPPLFIVTSPVADGRLWAEVLNLGGFDVISTPFDPFEAQHVAGTAIAYAGDTRARPLISGWR